MGMRARHMPKPVDQSWPAGMVVPVPMPVDVTGRARLRIAHDAQHARNTGLQHLDNNHPDATAKGSQTPYPRRAAHGEAGNPR